MGAGGRAGGPHIAYQLSLRHPGSHTDARGEAGQVHVAALVALHVLYPDTVAASGRIPAALGHCAVADCIYLRPRGRRVVYRRVGLYLACDGMLAPVGEAAADAVVAQGSLEEHPLEAHAALVPVGVGTSLARVEEHCGHLLAVAAVEEAEAHRVYAHQLPLALALGV